MTLTGTVAGSTTTDASGSYAFTSLVNGGSYVVTPSKASILPASAAINTVDAVAVQRHFLVTGLPLEGCPLAAADVNGDSAVNTIDAIAIQRFFLGALSGTANVGQYRFNPVSRSYSGVTTNQTGQNYDTMVLGDVVASFVELPERPSQDAMNESLSASKVTPAVAMVALPHVAKASGTSFNIEVTTSTIRPEDNLIAFQGDVTFDSTAIAFATEPVLKAGLTSGNWSVKGNVLAGTGPIRTLRISAFSNDFEPLSGSGAIFELRISKVSKPGQVTQLFWAAPPDHFIFIDADLKTHKPGYTAPGSLTPSMQQAAEPERVKEFDESIDSSAAGSEEENLETTGSENSADE